MKDKTQFQEFVFRIVRFILQDEIYQQNWDKPEYKRFLGENLRRYCEYTSNHKNIVNNINRLKRHCKFTEEAVREVDKSDSIKWKELKHLIHQEHILPISEAMNQLSNIMHSFDDDSISKILDKLEIVVISKRERNLLDGANGVGMKSKGEPKERLEAIGASLHKSYSHNEIS